MSGVAMRRPEKRDIESASAKPLRSAAASMICLSLMERKTVLKATSGTTTM